MKTKVKKRQLTSVLSILMTIMFACAITLLYPTVSFFDPNIALGIILVLSVPTYFGMKRLIFL